MSGPTTTRLTSRIGVKASTIAIAVSIRNATTRTPSAGARPNSCRAGRSSMASAKSRAPRAGPGGAGRTITRAVRPRNGASDGSWRVAAGGEQEPPVVRAGAEAPLGLRGGAERHDRVDDGRDRAAAEELEDLGELGAGSVARADDRDLAGEEVDEVELRGGARGRAADHDPPARRER